MNNLPPFAAVDRRRGARRAQEDLGRAGDITTQATIPASAQASAVIAAREEGVIAGLPLAREAFAQIDAEIASSLASKMARMWRRRPSSRA